MLASSQLPTMNAVATAMSRASGTTMATALRTNPAADLKAVHAGQTEIEDYQVVMRGRRVIARRG